MQTRCIVLQIKGFAKLVNLNKDAKLYLRTCDSFRELMLGKYVCNGVKDCSEGSDENFCPERFFCDAGTIAGLFAGKSMICFYQITFLHAVHTSEAIKQIIFKKSISCDSAHPQCCNVCKQ